MVDAGYLLKSGGKLISASDLPRHRIQLKVDEAVLALHEAAAICEPTSELLRIYWYDGTILPDRPTLEQIAVSEKRNCKLRLGSINAYGEQKGVDALMILDMLSLSRNGAVDSILLVTGDEDLRPAVDEAQSQGTRVHLLCVPALPGSANRSERLRRECDSCRELSVDDVAQFISIDAGLDAGASRPLQPAEPAAGPTVTMQHGPAADGSFSAVLDEVVDGASAEDLRAIVERSTSERPHIPPAIDRPLLARYARHLGRDPNETEKKAMRAELHRLARARSA